jgi:hypothetical protein
MTAYSASKEEARELRGEENPTVLGAPKRGRTRRLDRLDNGFRDTHLRQRPIGADSGTVGAEPSTNQLGPVPTVQHTETVEHRSELPPEWLRVSLTLCLIVLLSIASIAGLLDMVRNGLLTHLMEIEPRALLGIPWAGGASLVVVLILRSSFGTAEFKILGVHFKGASGPTVMWLLCFLAEVLAMRIL